MNFHIPNSNTQYVGDANHHLAQVSPLLSVMESFRPPFMLFLCLSTFHQPLGVREKIMSMANVGVGGEEAVVTFEGIAILTPR